MAETAIEKFWKPALAIGGIASIGAFVFFSLYKEWLKLDIFSKLSSDHTFIIMIVFLVLVFIVAITMLILWFVDKAPKGHGVSFSIPKNGATFEAVIRALVATEKTTVEFENFKIEELNSLVASQDIIAPTMDKAILLIRGLTTDVRKYGVERNDFGGYTVTVI